MLAQPVSSSPSISSSAPQFFEFIMAFMPFGVRDALLLPLDHANGIHGLDEALGDALA
ncbi:hypothetical protein N878_03895 [Pseudomonas sp. EGD-AK9]|nr:hypothetical protein N878_03895 [Pseudomonas sp. EGD-AK9]